MAKETNDLSHLEPVDNGDSSSKVWKRIGDDNEIVGFVVQTPNGKMEFSKREAREASEHFENEGTAKAMKEKFNREGYDMLSSLADAYDREIAGPQRGFDDNDSQTRQEDSAKKQSFYDRVNKMMDEWVLRSDDEIEEKEEGWTAQVIATADTKDDARVAFVMRYPKDSI